MPRTPPSRCTKPNCPNLAAHKGRCLDHQSSGWTDRRRPQDRAPRAEPQRLGITKTQWQDLTIACLTQAQGICYWCGKPGADVADHILPVALGGAKTSLDNLGAMHQHPCHDEKTVMDLTEMRRRARAARRGEA